MVGSAAQEQRFNWGLPLSVVAGAGIAFASVMVYSPYGNFLYILFIAPVVCLTLFVLLVIAAIRERRLQCLSLSIALIAFLAVSAALQMEKDWLRSSLRWALWSGRFKAELLAQPHPINEELRHMEWEATGFAGVANQAVYLVFDPLDSLLAAAKTRRRGKFRGIPCEVPHVRRLESHWYAVWFYADETWGQRNRLDCTGAGT